jgi:hypothetical protein
MRKPAFRRCANAEWLCGRAAISAGSLPKAPLGQSLSFAQEQRTAQYRCVPRKFDVHRLPRSQVLERVRQRPQIGCLDAAENQQPVTRFEPGVFGSGSRLHAADSYAFALVGHIGHDAGGGPAGRGRCRRARRLCCRRRA